MRRIRRHFHGTTLPYASHNTTHFRTLIPAHIAPELSIASTDIIGLLLASCSVRLSVFDLSSRVELIEHSESVSKRRYLQNFSSAARSSGNPSARNVTAISNFDFQAP